jgi:hypothetical protein
MANSSLQFSGAGTDYVTIPSNTNLDLTTPFTIAFWIYPIGSGFELILEKGNIDSTGAYLVELNSARKVVFTIPTVVNVGGGGRLYRKTPGRMS